MIYHYPIYMPCFGTSEDRPCPDNAVGMGILKVSEAGPEVGRAEETVPPGGWSPLKVKPPAIHRWVEKARPFDPPWVMAAKTQTVQMTVTCPKCSEHLKVEDAVLAASKGTIQ